MTFLYVYVLFFITDNVYLDVLCGSVLCRGAPITVLLCQNDSTSDICIANFFVVSNSQHSRSVNSTVH